MLKLILVCITAASARQLGSIEKIVNGQDTELGDHPYQAILQFRGSLRCGAVIVSDTQVLTAAHCVGNGKKARRYTVVINVNNRVTEGTTIRVRSIDMHERYGRDAGFASNDIAILTLRSSITGAASSIPIAEADMNFEGQTCTISGFGRLGDGDPLAVINQETTGTIMTTAECRAIWGSSATETMICINNSTSGSCNGDSGGPMVCQKDGVDYLAGITSWGHRECDLTQYPSVYTKVSSFNAWINSRLN